MVADLNAVLMPISIRFHDHDQKLSTIDRDQQGVVRSGCQLPFRICAIDIDFRTVN